MLDHAGHAGCTVNLQLSSGGQTKMSWRSLLTV